MKKFILVVILSACFSQIWGQADHSEIGSLVTNMLPRSSEVGVYAYDLTADKVVFAYQHQKLCRPASTLKLLTAVTALSELDDDKKPFRTEVWTNGVIRNDTLYGNLHVVGGFDPEFDDQAMNLLVRDLSTLSFSVMTGKVYADISMKDSLYWGSGWAWDDNPEAFQPYLSPLMFNKGVVKVTAMPSAVSGRPAKLSCVPTSSYYVVRNRTLTQSPDAGRFTVSRDWLKNGNTITVSGNVDRPTVGWVNVYSSSDFFMETLLERLRAKGIRVPSSFVYAPLGRRDHIRCLASHDTSLQEVVNQLMKESDNLNGQALLCRLGVEGSRKKGVSDKDGIVELQKMIRLLGHDPADYQVVDGCGLSNYNYITPQLLVDLLRYAYSREELFARLSLSLPIAGVDGTLKNRMKNSPAYNNVRAKTGSFTAINTLAGYLKRGDGHVIAFAIMNQNILSAAKARAFQDRVCISLCK